MRFVIMPSLYGQDLAYIHAAAYSGLARGAAPEIVRRLKSASIEIRKVVDAGCGAGPLAAALVQAGFEVTGMDSSAELLGMAREAVPEAHFVHGSVYEAAIPPCEALVALGETLSYHAEGTDADSLVQRFIQRVSGILPAGGIFIFDVVESGEPSMTGRFWNSGEDWAVLVEVQEERDSRTLIRNIETLRRVDQLYRRGREIHRLRVFDSAVICEQLAACGFATETAQAYGSQSLDPRRRAFFCTRIGRS